MLLKKTTNRIFLILCVLIIILAVFLSGDTPPKDEKIISSQNAAQKVDPSISTKNTNTVSTTDKYFNSNNLVAKSVYVFDVKNNVAIYEFNAEVPLPLASVAKIATVLIALKNVRNPDYLITIQKEEAETLGEYGLIANEQWKLSDLAAYTLMASSNGGAVALARISVSESGKSWDELVRNLSREIGLSQTILFNPIGLDETKEIGGAYGSAHDVAIMMTEGIRDYGSIFEYTIKDSYTFISHSGNKHSAKNTNSNVVSSIGLIASKTGTTRVAGGNLVIAFNAGPNRPIIISLLGSTEDERAGQVDKLVSATLNTLNDK